MALADGLSSRMGMRDDIEGWEKNRSSGWQAAAQVRMEDGGSQMGRSIATGDTDRFEKCLEAGVSKIYCWVWKPGGLGACTPNNTWNLDWPSISHMVIYMFQCYSLKPSHPRLLLTAYFTLPTNVHIVVKTMVFMYGCESWTIKKAEC